MYIVRWVTILILATLSACMADAPVTRAGHSAKHVPHLGKPTVPIIVNVTHSEKNAEITVVATAKVMTDAPLASFEIFQPDEVELVAGNNRWQGSLTQGEEVSLTATYKIVQPVAVYPISWRALLNAQAGGLNMSMQGYTHYGTAQQSKSLSRSVSSDTPKVRAGSLEFKGQ